MTDFPTQLEECMHARNFHIRGRIDYRKTGFQRFPSSNGHNRRRDLFVIIHDGDRGATFGDWHYPDDWYTCWNTAYGKPTISQQLEIDARCKLQLQDQAVERSKREYRARQFWHKFYVSEYADEHPYVIRKRFRPYYGRQCRSWLLVPVRDIDYGFVTMQIIKPNGFKRLWKGTGFKGNMIWLSEPLPSGYTGVIRVCEGYATGCTIYEAIGSPVVCSINASNIISVIKQLCAKFPLATLVVCADNDVWVKDNPGITYAITAMKLTGAIMRCPVFDGFDISSRPSDFNDLLILGGIEIVENQLLKQY